MEALLNVVLPVFGIIFAGYLSRRSGLLGTASAEALNRFAYYIALPPLLFQATARTPIGVILNGPFIAVYLGGILLTLLITLPIARYAFGHRSLTLLSLHSLAAVFANVVYMGVPLFLAAFGPDGTTPVVTVFLVGNLVLLVGIACVEFGQAEGSARHIIGDVLLSLLRNPLLCSMLAGMAVSYLQLPLPTPLTQFLTLLGAAAAPTALFALGLALYGYPLHGDVVEVSWITLLKLVVHPLLTWVLVQYVFELEPFWGNAAVLLAATPTGALVFVVAQKYNVYVQRGAAVIVASTLLSMVTLTLLFSWLADTQP